MAGLPDTEFIGMPVRHNTVKYRRNKKKKKIENNTFCNDLNYKKKHARTAVFYSSHFSRKPIMKSDQGSHEPQNSANAKLQMATKTVTNETRKLQTRL